MSLSGVDRRKALNDALEVGREASAALKDVSGRSANRMRQYGLYLEGDLLIELGQVGDGLTHVGLAAILLRREVGDAQSEELMAMAVVIALAYWQLGDPQTAAAFQLEALKLAPKGSHMGSEALKLVAMVYESGDSETAGDLVGDLFEGNMDQAPPRAAGLAFGQLLGLRQVPLAELEWAIGGLEPFGPNFVGYARRALADALHQRSEPVRAAAVLEEAVRSVQGDGDESHEPWLSARLQQHFAVALLAADEHARALEQALEAWVVLEESRYQTASTRLRAAAYSSYATARQAAFDAAVAAADWRTLTELIEAARLQAQPDIEGDPADIRSLRTAAQANASHASAAERPDVSEGVPVPPLYGIVIRDAFEGRSELLVPPEVTVLGHSVLAETRHRLAKTMQHIRPRERSIALEEVLRTTADLDDALVWSSWIEGGAIYWTLAWGSTVIDGGVLRPEDAPETFAAIAAIAAAHDVESPWFNPGSVDVVAALEDADGPEEQLLTQPLSALLPEPLRSALLAAEEPRDLVMAVAPEIAFLPWPIIAIEEADIGGRRLVEAATLRFVPSATALEAARRWLTTSNGSTPFLVACDNPTGDLIEVSPRAAFRRFGAESRTPMHEDVEVATALAVIEYLRTLKPGTPGLAFFRGHASWDDEDPTQSSLVMAGGDSIPAGLFFVRDAETGGPAIPLPSTVILSCCSTSGVRGRRGGESLGLVAGCLAAGASRVFATNVDVVETPFTNALDDMLIEIALDDGDQFAALRELQLKLLNEWRDSSTRWSGSLLDAAHPIVWAH